MSFWSSEKLKSELGKQFIITPYNDPSRVKHGAYELSLGGEYFTTADNSKIKVMIQDSEQISIAPGQFALLITQERIRIPDDAMGFISIKAGIKFKGLINVSGFHVDPGFHGRLKFAVYNAGSQHIKLTQGKPIFLIWFTDLDQKTVDIYNGRHANGEGICSNDVMNIAGNIASPAQLHKRLTSLELKLNILTPILISIVVGVVLLLLRTFPPQQAREALPHIQPSAETRHTTDGSVPPSTLAPKQKGE
jgi:dCTP deaminase